VFLDSDGSYRGHQGYDTVWSDMRVPIFYRNPTKIKFIFLIFKYLSWDVSHDTKCEEREKPNKMQQLDVYYQLLSQYTICSNAVFVLLKMGIMMPETF